MTMTVRSDSFKDGDYLAETHILSAAFGFGCEGDNRSPHLAWSGAPAGTKSFAVTCFDPDAPTGSGFWHWLVVNISPDVTELALDAGNPKNPKLPPGAARRAMAAPARRPAITRTATCSWCSQSAPKACRSPPIRRQP
jgi:hypothetical protein